MPVTQAQLDRYHKGDVNLYLASMETCLAKEKDKSSKTLGGEKAKADENIARVQKEIDDTKKQFGVK